MEKKYQQKAAEGDIWKYVNGRSFMLESSTDRRLQAGDEHSASGQ
jgi:hypothetical protein